MVNKRISLLLLAMIPVMSGCMRGFPDDAGMEDFRTDTVSETPAGEEETGKEEPLSGEGTSDETVSSEGQEPEEEGEPGSAGDSREWELSEGIKLPNLMISDYHIPENDALSFVYDMGVGINLGNTFDAYNDGTLSDEMSLEEYWGNPGTTREMIRDIRSYGFDTLRIPVSWHNHVSGDCEISKQWLDRVNEVVDWALEEDLHVIINIHHDNHPEAGGIYPDEAHFEQSKHYVERIWSQLSERFRDYDDRLIFESMNEPRLVGTEYEWYVDGNGGCDEAMECINRLNQAFVDTVRSSGGNNVTRYLMCPGYDASPEGALHEKFRLPTDIPEADNRIMVSIHAYTPYGFALEYPGTGDFSAVNKDDTKEINAFMNKLYNVYVSNGIPVVIGEFGARDKGGNLQSRVDYCAYYVREARSCGISCLMWDNNLFSGSGENFGVYNRREPEKTLTDIIAALQRYAY